MEKIIDSHLGQPMTPPLNLFISYTHKDEDLKDELAIHLASLKREGAINPWQD